MPAWFLLCFLITIAQCLMVVSVNECPTSCADHHMGSSVRCTMSDEICPSLSKQGLYTVSKPQFGFNIAVKNRRLMLEVRFRPCFDVTIEDLKGFQINLNVSNHENVFKRQVEKFYCIDDKKLSFKKHDKLLFSYCFDYIFPGDKLVLSVKSLPYNKVNSIDQEECFYDDFEFCPIRKFTVPSCSEGEGYDQVNFCKYHPNLLVHDSNSKLDNGHFFQVFYPAEFETEVKILLLPFNRTLWRKQLKINNTPFNKTVKLDLKKLCGNFTLVLRGNSTEYQDVVLKMSSAECTTYLQAVLISFLTVAIVVAICFLVMMYRKKMEKSKASKHHYSEAVQQTPCNEVVNANPKVYIGFYDSNPVFLELIVHFADYMMANLGFEVVFEPWSEDEVQQGLSVWVEKALTVCNKFILVWSPGSIKLLENLDNSRPCDSEGGSFIPMALQIKSELLRCSVKKHDFLSVYFDSDCARSIPAWFCRLIDRHFFLMEQFVELYFSLIDREIFHPGRKTQPEFEKVDSAFTQLLEVYRRSCRGDIQFPASNTNILRKKRSLVSLVSPDDSANFLLDEDKLPCLVPPDPSGTCIDDIFLNMEPPEL